MCILWVLLDDNVEVLYSLFVHFNHLVSLGSLVDVANVRWNVLDAFAEWENTLFKLFHPAVS